jgi:hypothetical protein
VTPDSPDQHPLPSNRAFVVQLHANADPSRALLFGRVEHVLSARAAHFETLDELLAFITRTLSSSA